MRRLNNWIKKAVRFNSTITTTAAVNSGPLNVSGTATFESIIMTDATSLPTSDPVVAGQLWNDTGTVKVSTGS